MNSLQLKNLLLRKLYIEDPTTLAGTILGGLEDDVVAAINRAYQVIWTAPLDYFRRGEYTFATVSGTQAYTLEQGIQAIEGVVKLNGGTPHVAPIQNRADFDNYGTRFLNQLTNTIANAIPQGYFLQKFGQENADSVLLKMLFVPTPDDAYTVTFEASSEAPNLTLANVDAGVDLHIPANYVESILMPLARYFVTGSHFFMVDHRPQEWQEASGDFGKAMAQLGYADPDIDQFKIQQPVAANG